ncbi:MAG: hypothetical protein DRI24_23365, partial [Deltaproteobacteria bacterium]
MITEEQINKFKQAKLLAIDIETKDNKLIEFGPGTHRGDGHICGIVFGCEIDNKIETEYLSFTHPDTAEGIAGQNMAIAKDILSVNNEKIGAN